MPQWQAVAMSERIGLLRVCGWKLVLLQYGLAGFFFVMGLLVTGLLVLSLFGVSFIVHFIAVGGLAAGLFVGGIQLYFACARMIIRGAIRDYQGRFVFCPSCGYDLRATTGATCPECGGEIDGNLRRAQQAVPAADVGPGRPDDDQAERGDHHA